MTKDTIGIYVKYQYLGLEFPQIIADQMRHAR